MGRKRVKEKKQRVYIKFSSREKGGKKRRRRRERVRVYKTRLHEDIISFPIDASKGKIRFRPRKNGKGQRKSASLSILTKRHIFASLGQKKKGYEDKGITSSNAASSWSWRDWTAAATTPCAAVSQPPLAFSVLLAQPSKPSTPRPCDPSSSF